MTWEVDGIWMFWALQTEAFLVFVFLCVYLCWEGFNFYDNLQMIYKEFIRTQKLRVLSYLYAMLLKSVSTGTKFDTSFPLISGILGMRKSPYPLASLPKSKSLIRKISPHSCLP